MRLIYIVIALIIIIVAGGGYYLYYLKSLEALNTYKPLVNPSSAQSSNSTSDENCSEFTTRFGTSASDLVQFINSEPDAVEVMRGYRYISGTITSLTPGNNLPVFITYDENGKIISWECTQKKTKDPTKDFSFTMPETDFAQIVRYRESLEESQAQTYLQNVTTNPGIVKSTILQRIQNLSL